MEYKLIRAKRRSTTIQIEDDATITVRAPFLMPKLLIDRFVNSKKSWVLKKQQQVQKQISLIKRTYSHGDNYLYLGQNYPLKITNNVRAKLLFADSFELAELLRPKAKILFEKWYKTQANELFARRLTELSAVIQVKFSKLHLSGGIRRWGSYSPRSGTISLSWRLIMAPKEVIDYVIIHELCHIIQPNHSKHFWDVVVRYDANYKSSIKWLKNNGRSLSI
jgi:predicted metal-dependent hydrolase